MGLASHANAMANRLRAGFASLNSARLAWPTTANEVFAILPKAAAEAATEKGAKFYDWLVPRDMPEKVGKDEVLIRMVTSFATTETDVDEFLSICAAV
ncbi:hypothetical protein D3C80_1244950 [compost metagenome]